MARRWKSSEFLTWHIIKTTSYWIYNVQNIIENNGPWSSSGVDLPEIFKLPGGVLGSRRPEGVDLPKFGKLPGGVLGSRRPEGVDLPEFGKLPGGVLGSRRPEGVDLPEFGKLPGGVPGSGRREGAAWPEVEGRFVYIKEVLPISTF
jgi:hypothetical protein